MNILSEYQNDTISLNHINTLMPLISLMSTHFLVNSFVLISDMETTMEVNFTKIASKYFLKINSVKTFERNVKTKGENVGYIIFQKVHFDFSKVLKTKPLLIAVVYTMEDPLGSNDLSELVIPPSTSFYSIFLSYKSPEIVGKCVQLYKPTPDMVSRSFPKMFYEGSNKPNWTWENSKMTWNSIQKEIRNMSGVNVTIALASSNDRALAESYFWNGKNSFFWKEMAVHLGFRSKIHFRHVSAKEIKSVAKVYVILLMTAADGLGVLPALSADRIQYLEFVLTGLDTKYQLMVKYPEYVYSWQSIFKPLSFYSWMGLAFSVFLISITLRIAISHQTSTPSEFSSCCLIIFGFVCSQGCPNVPQNLSGRLVCYTALLFSIIVYQFYTSNFYSLLSTKEVSLPFTSLEQFFLKKTHSLYLHPDTAIYAQIMNAKNGTYKRLWDEVLMKDPSHQLKADTRKNAFVKVCNGKGAILGLPYQTVHLHDLPCKIVPVNSGYFPVSVITVVRKKFPFKSQFKFVHMRLLEGGISHKFRDEELHNNLQYSLRSEVENESVSLEHVAFLFAFLLASILLSWLILTFEIIASKTIKKKKLKKGIPVRTK